MDSNEGWQVLRQILMTDCFRMSIFRLIDLMLVVKRIDFLVVFTKPANFTVVQQIAVNFKSFQCARQQLF